VDQFAAVLGFSQLVQAFARFLIVSERCIQMAGVDFFGDGGQETLQRFPHVADQTKIEWAAIAERFRTHIDLRDLGVLGEELTVGKIRAQQ
jgi:hypothetical protein